MLYQLSYAGNGRTPNNPFSIARPDCAGNSARFAGATRKALCRYTGIWPRRNPPAGRSRSSSEFRMAVAYTTRFKRTTLHWHRKMRELYMILKGLADTDHPLLAHVIPTRRCNIACAYCNEYDDFSNPVPIDDLKKRTDKLAALGVSIVTLSGGEPLLHPQLDELIAHIRSHGIIAGLITNGYLLGPKRIRELNRAGLEYLQISIDNINPDKTSMKSLRVLDRKLEMLAEHAYFDVNINSVVGGGIPNPEDAYKIACRALALGFTSTVGIIHDGSGQLQPLSEAESSVYRRIKALSSKRGYSRLTFFQDNLVEGRTNNWKCRAGARYLYICEDGLVHFCSQQRGYPGIPLERYSVADIRKAYRSAKSCAPACTVSCVHKASAIDFWRDPQTPIPADQQQPQRV